MKLLLQGTEARWLIPAKKPTVPLGHRVSVTGAVENGTLKIDSIATIKMEAQTQPGNHQEESMH